MSDSTSAYLFGNILKLLADRPNEQNKELAEKIFKMSRNYDFSYSEMEAEEAGMKLGLCVYGVDTDYPEEGEVFIWKDALE